MNDESGVLIEGFEREPMIKQPWHPPYYQRLCEGAGLEKAIDLFMWELHVSTSARTCTPRSSSWPRSSSPSTASRSGKMSRRHLRRDLDLFGETWNDAWKDNWGFVPYSKEDLDHYAQELQLVFDQQLVHGGRERRGRGGRRGHHRAGHQPGAEADERAAPAVRLVALPAPAARSWTACGWASSASRRSTSTPAWRRACSPSTSRWRRATPADLGRGGLDPRDQRRDEPRHGGDGREDRQEYRMYERALV